MSVVEILSAALNPYQADGEYQWCESIREEHGREWEGNVVGYVKNLDMDEGMQVLEKNDFTIHNEPAGAVVVVDEDGKPVQMFWAEALDDNIWHAVQTGPDDNDWDGIGSRSRAAAIAMAAKYSEGRVAVIDEGNSFCLEVIKADQIDRPE